MGTEQVYTMNTMKILLLLLATLLALSACTPSEPLIFADAAEGIRGALGYALAPTYLPKGLEPAELSGGGTYGVNVREQTKTAYLLYTLSDQRSATTLILTYPEESYEKYSYTMERFGMVHPEDAVTEISINGETAHLFHGRWTRDTLDRLSRLDTSQDPEWGYDNGHVTIRFEFLIPDGGRIWVSLATVFPTDQVTEQDIVKIAESVVVVE